MCIPGDFFRSSIANTFEFFHLSRAFEHHLEARNELAM